MKRYLIILQIVVTSLWTITSARSALPLPAENFQVNGRDAFLMKAEKPMEGHPWVWFAPTLKNYPSAANRFYLEKLLERGIAIAGYDLGEVRGAAGSSQLFSGFYDAMVGKGYSAKPILLGQSRGGLMLLCWSFRNPDKVRAFVGIYPVSNLADWPLRESKSATLADYGMSEEALLKQMDALNPLENLAGLAKNRVPMFVLHGDADATVPLSKNSMLLKDAYEKAGGDITLITIPGQGHNISPLFFTNQDLVPFVLKQMPEK